MFRVKQLISYDLAMAADLSKTLLQIQVAISPLQTQVQILLGTKYSELRDQIITPTTNSLFWLQTLVLYCLFYLAVIFKRSFQSFAPCVQSFATSNDLLGMVNLAKH